VLGCFFSSCSPQNKFGKSKKDITAINNRKSLKDEQERRERHAARYKAYEGQQNSEVTRAQQENDKEVKKAIEKDKKRHQSFQSKETRKRMKKNEKESNKKSFWD
jgi:hypothetical protein